MGQIYEICGKIYNFNSLKEAKQHCNRFGVTSFWNNNKWFVKLPEGWFVNYKGRYYVS